MISLGIESTAHTFGIGICTDKGKILSNVKDVYKPEKGWGIKPMDAANHHKIFSHVILNNALNEAKLDLKDIDIFSFSRGPGLPPCLHVGKNVALALAEKTKKPLYGVNHPVAHIEIGKLTTKAKDPVIVYASGANTQITSLIDKKYRVFGETEDIGIGNALDKFARVTGLNFPGGPEIEKTALRGNYIELPYVVKGMDLSFTGIISDAVRKYKQGSKLEDLCFSIQENCFSMLTEVTERALAHTGKKEALLTGGVAANKRLQEMLTIMCKERKGKLYSVPKEYAMDNGAMISWLGILSHRSKQVFKNDDINPIWRVDEVTVDW